MPLSVPQVKFVNEAARPMIERLIRIRSELDAFVVDFDNLQVALPAGNLDDNDTGTAPRADAPVLTAADVTNLRNFCANMRNIIDNTAGAYTTLVRLSVRPVEQILR